MRVAAIVESLTSQVVSARRELMFRDDEIKHYRSQAKSTVTSQQPHERSVDHQMNVPRQSTPSEQDVTIADDLLSSDQQLIESVSSVEDQVSAVEPETTRVEETEEMKDVSLHSGVFCVCCCILMFTCRREKRLSRSGMRSHGFKLAVLQEEHGNCVIAVLKGQVTDVVL